MVRADADRNLMSNGKALGEDGQVVSGPVVFVQSCSGWALRGCHGSAFDPRLTQVHFRAER